MAHHRYYTGHKWLHGQLKKDIKGMGSEELSRFGIDLALEVLTEGPVGLPAFKFLAGACVLPIEDGKALISMVETSKGYLIWYLGKEKYFPVPEDIKTSQMLENMFSDFEECTKDKLGSDPYEKLLADVRVHNKKYLRCTFPDSPDDDFEKLTVINPEFAEGFFKSMRQECDPSDTFFAERLITARTEDIIKHRAVLIDPSKRWEYLKELRRLTWGDVPREVLAAGLISRVDFGSTPSYIRRMVRETKL